ncbi:uncharacterized protein MICPUCDRAFT_13786, partial [Micromonas pusilla CCMP1545]
MRVAEAINTDPQQRVLLLTAVNADVMSCMEKKAIGVYTGMSYVDYAKIIARDINGFTSQTASGTSQSVASGRLAYTFDLKGPALSIDTACSSSLVAAHIGTRAVGTRECATAAISICGVNLTLLAYTTAMFQRAGMLAPDGRCKTLDASADGYVRAEGCEIILLAASSDDVTQLSVALGGSAVNQDGRSSSLTAPNGPTQHAVIKSALLDGRFSASDVTSLHLHGTGT